MGKPCLHLHRMVHPALETVGRPRACPVLDHLVYHNHAFLYSVNSPHIMFITTNGLCFYQEVALKARASQGANYRCSSQSRGPLQIQGTRPTEAGRTQCAS